jgi:hypothetical protein
MAIRNEQIAAFRERVVRRIDAVKRAMAFDVWTRLMLRTPVDTGQARASWKGSVDRINLEAAARPSQVQRDDEGRCTNPTPPPQPPRFAPSSDPARVYFITNNVQHIPFLVQGSSSQAPAGWADEAINETKAGFAGIVQEVVNGDGGL